MLSRVEVITSAERRRRWSRAEKERLVAASFEPGVCVSEVARSAGLHVSQLFCWRKMLCAGLASGFLPVTIAPAPDPQPEATSSTVAEPIDYLLRRWPAFTRFRDDGRICLTNNAAERALRGFALGRKAWLFAGSERGAERAAAMARLIVTAKLNGVDPQAWLADVLARIAEHPAHRLNELLPWNWRPAASAAAAQAA